LAFDRDGTLKKAEKLLRQGRLDAAIAEYVRVVEENPRDWSTGNTLGELYGRAGQTDRAVEQYSRIAEHFVADGFYPKAAALYKKILKVKPLDEASQLQLAEISAKQGLLADAKSHLNAIAARRRERGDRRGAAEIIVRLGTIDPADFDARLAAARTLEEMGEEEEAGTRFKALHHDLVERGRIGEALDALREFVRINPLESEARAILAKAALEKGDLAAAREFLDEHSAGDDPSLLLSLVEIELRSGELQRAKGLMSRLMAVAPEHRKTLAELGWSFLDTNPERAFACLDTAVDAAVTASDFPDAAATLQEFAARVPGQIPALLKLVEVCVDGGLETAMYEAQERLTDAYLEAGQAAEARVIAEDLVAREPWEPAHIDRFRRALVMLRVPEPDSLIAERLSGQAPFMAQDPFFEGPDPSPPQPAAAEAPVEPGSEVSEGHTPVEEGPVEEGVDAADVTFDEEPAPVEAEPAAPQETRVAVSAPEPKTRRDPFDEIDLTGALGDLHEAQPAAAPERDLSQAFSEMRDEARADADYSTQHMTLARTYLEIGMLDEAIASLETAARSPRQRFEAASMLGRLYQRRGDADRAIDWFERAAEAPAPTADEGRVLLYDLGVLLEGAGETSRALAVFLELQADAGDYRDVPPRIERLARVQTGG
jgi:tetratricopeptide (TPR) repeat protein